MFWRDFPSYLLTVLQSYSPTVIQSSRLPVIYSAYRIKFYCTFILWLKHP